MKENKVEKRKEEEGEEKILHTAQWLLLQLPWFIQFNASDNELSNGSPVNFSNHSTCELPSGAKMPGCDLPPRFFMQYRNNPLENIITLN